MSGRRTARASAAIASRLRTTGRECRSSLRAAQSAARLGDSSLRVRASDALDHFVRPGLSGRDLVCGERRGPAAMEFFESAEKAGRPRIASKQNLAPTQLEVLFRRREQNGLRVDEGVEVG